MRLIYDVQVFSGLITNCNHKLSPRWCHINAATSGCGAKQAFQRQIWMTWMCTEDNQLTKGGNRKRPSLSMVTTWVKEAWEDIPAEMVMKSFLKTGISNSMDGTEDDHIGSKRHSKAPNDTARLQTTQPTSCGAVTADSSCCANCVEPPRPQQWGPDLPFFGHAGHADPLYGWRCCSQNRVMLRPIQVRQL